MDPTPLSTEEMDLIRTKILGEIVERPPTIGVIGVSGVGKSSTINTLLGASLATSDAVACTKEFWSVKAELEFTTGQARGLSAYLQIFDAPGLGEDVRRGAEYLDEYHRHLPACDVVVWLMAARNRALALDQRYLTELSEFLPRMVFGLNQVDLVEPLDWHQVLNGPSPRQGRSIAEITEDRQRRLSDVVQQDVTVVPYSAKARYNLQTLFTAIVQACPPDRAWLFTGLKSFTYDDFLTDEARRLLDDAARPAGAINGIKSLLTRKLGL